MSPVRLLLVSVLVSFCSLALESSLLSIGLPLALVPELVLLFVIFVSFYETTPLGTFLAFLCGLMVDISGGQLLGPWAGSFVLCFGAVSLISDRIFIESGLSLMSVAFVLTLLSQFIFLLISVDPISQLFSEWAITIGRALTTAFIAPLFFPLLKRMLSYSKTESLRRRQSRSYA